jgi:AraC family ethanolamine operon transcriptional activator
MDAIVYRLESRDFKEMEHALSAWDHRYRQISPGAFRGGLLHTQVGSLGVFRNRWERAIHYLGVAPEGTVALGLTLAQSGEGRWNGQRMGPDDMLVAGCGTEGEYLSAPLWDSVVFAIPETELTRQIAELTHDDPRGFVAHGVARLTPQAAAQVRQAARAYLDASARALARPDAPSQLIREAEAYCAHNKAQPLRIGQLCHETGLSERSLREAFHKLTGMSPLAYLKTEQLNRAYDLLRVSNPDETLVKNVALANGFTHLGHYKQLFGELPSATLQRR